MSAFSLSLPRHGTAPRRPERRSPAAGAYFTAIKAANKRLAELHIEPISERVSPIHCDEPTPACGRS